MFVFHKMNGTQHLFLVDLTNVMVLFLVVLKIVVLNVFWYIWKYYKFNHFFISRIRVLYIQNITVLLNEIFLGYIFTITFIWEWVVRKVLYKTLQIPWYCKGKMNCLVKVFKCLFWLNFLIRTFWNYFYLYIKVYRFLK